MFRACPAMSMLAHIKLVCQVLDFLCKLHVCNVMCTLGTGRVVAGQGGGQVPSSGGRFTAGSVQPHIHAYAQIYKKCPAWSQETPHVAHCGEPAAPQVASLMRACARVRAPARDARALESPIVPNPFPCQSFWGPGHPPAWHLCVWPQRNGRPGSVQGQFLLKLSDNYRKKN